MSLYHIPREVLQEMAREDYISQNSQQKIVFCGAHRTGKTVTADLLSKVLGIPFISSKVSESSIWSFFKPSDNMTFAERVFIQNIILKEYRVNIERKIKSISSFTPGYIFDRSPLDVLAYLLCNIDSTTSSMYDKEIKNFIDDCVQLTDQFFDTLIFVPPGIGFVTEPSKNNKVYNSYAYQESLSSMIIGFIYRFYDRFTKPKKIIMLPENCLDINKRIEYIQQQSL